MQPLRDGTLDVLSTTECITWVAAVVAVLDPAEAGTSVAPVWGGLGASVVGRLALGFGFALGFDTDAPVGGGGGAGFLRV